MKKYFTMIAFGLLMQFDIRIWKGIDILPNALGFFAMGYGLMKLKQYSGFLKKGSFVAFVTGVVTIPDVYPSYVDFGEVTSFVPIAVELITVALTLVTVYCLVRGIREIAEEQLFTSIAESSKNRWQFYFGLNLATVFFGAILLQENFIVTFFYVFAVAGSYMSLLFIVDLVFEARERLFL